MQAADTAFLPVPFDSLADSILKKSFNYTICTCIHGKALKIVSASNLGITEEFISVLLLPKLHP